MQDIYTEPLSVCLSATTIDPEGNTRDPTDTPTALIPGNSDTQTAHLVSAGLHTEDVLRLEVSVNDTLAVQETNPSIWRTKAPRLYISSVWV